MHNYIKKKIKTITNIEFHVINLIIVVKLKYVLNNILYIWLKKYFLVPKFS